MATMRHLFDEAQIVELKNLFLNAYKKRGLFHRAAEVAGLTAEDINYFLKNDEEFAAQYNLAKEQFVESLEEVAHTRALAGESDTLLQFLLRANKPDKYNPSVAMNVNAPKGAQIMLMFSEGELTDEERARLNAVTPEEIEDE